MSDIQSVLELSGRLISFAVILQTIEFFQIRKTFGEHGVWKWSVIRQEFNSFPNWIRWGFDRILDYPGFLSLLVLRLISAFAVLILPWSEIYSFFPCILFLSTLLICIRWRGTFNGGSDYMTIIITSALAIAKLFDLNPWIGKACLWYIAVQCCFSYFISGCIKLRNRDWRAGKQLGFFFQLPCYETPERLKELVKKKPWLAFSLSWSAMAFECAFPLALLSPRFCLFFIPLAFCFHLGNIYAFGLNRFLFAWSAAYPALYYCSRSHG